MTSTGMAAFVSRGPGGRLWKKKDPAILAALEQLLQEDTAGDPSRRLKWKRQSLHRLSELLGSAHPASAPTVARLLREMDFSPKVNRKQLAESSPHRDQQFRYLHSQKRRFLRRGWPVLSIDTKKRELIGWFKNPGTIWCRAPIAVNADDFRSLAEGVAIPAGMYDLARNEGFVMVGTSANTAQFTVDALRWWWREYGHRQYPPVPALLLLADGGGSHGYRVRLWKYSVQRRLVNPTGLQVTVCHYPKGASKWNPVEHRLFGEIRINWAGQPLINYQRVLAMIRGTTTKQGLVVHATLNEKRYATKIKISDEQMQEVQLYRHRVLPQWNYTLKPARD
jgi:Rhodopirellula transposase DDE domain